MDLQLEDRVILVVGGRGLIGSAVVDLLRKEGAIAIPASRSTTEGVQLDASQDDSVAEAVATVLERHGRIDGLVVAAAPAAGTLDSSTDSDPAEILKALDAKALTFLRVAKAVVPAMQDAGYGRVVGVSGQNAFLTGSMTGSMRNAALIVAAKNLADTLAGTGVSVNTVSPGPVTTEPSAAVEIGKPGESSPEDVANLILYLVSPLAGAVSGESIAVGHRVRGVTAF
ncbi:SDR family NAD(P)-dependent oxidoreductase [Gulosibacter molinativorax]|uniref:SDR family NAD(P)-dependent oxidoreductase n=2 Tax=Gulosibacter molinativorax TaxID=256821 RepID=A0ABT7C915_9MICO|nr:SDR family oxidoreductase [Gulosibacter molinativorax]MDJ1371706.1 SDR family NAD(P)-dependent oxidoreductase [Gulosibacter molinativorax]QUY63127.1 Dehydrogenases with different specificities (Related to short-chain alcohol dehydrogenases) [Gulosibacter molinativorax]